MSIRQYIILEFPDTLSHLDFDQVLLESPLKNCILGMLFTCSISGLNCYMKTTTVYYYYYSVSLILEPVFH